MKDNGLTTKEKIAYGLAVGTMICGLVLLFVSLAVPPEGEINSSVLYAFGEISLFAGSLMGIWINDLRIRKDEKDR